LNRVWPFVVPSAAPCREDEDGECRDERVEAQLHDQKSVDQSDQEPNRQHHRDSCIAAHADAGAADRRVRHHEPRRDHRRKTDRRFQRQVELPTEQND
jgi:hypothetical protein